MCYKPTKPSCVDSYSEFWSRFEAESCKDDVERFANDMKVYQMCLQDEFSFVKREVDSTISEFVDKVKRSDNMR